MKSIVIKGYGPRTDRVHIFDKKTGKFLASGYIRNKILYSNKIISGAVMIRKYHRRNK